MDEFTLHDLLHPYASGLIAAGRRDVVTVQHTLENALPSITLNTYSHLGPRRRTALATLLLT
jgi:hypothetical protein